MAGCWESLFLAWAAELALSVHVNNKKTKHANTLCAELLFVWIKRIVLARLCCHTLCCTSSASPSLHTIAACSPLPTPHLARHALRILH